MGRYGIGARVRDEDGDEGVIVGKRKGERQVDYEHYGKLWQPKSDLTVIAANDDTPAAAVQVGFKVGDRVKCTQDYDAGNQFTEGREYTVRSVSDSGDWLGFESDDRGSTTNGWSASHFEPATPEWQPKVGDRARKKRAEGYIRPADSAGTIAEKVGDMWRVEFDAPFQGWGESNSWHYNTDDLEPLPVAEQPAGEKWVPEVGQRVRRLNYDHANFSVGDVGVVAHLQDKTTIFLEGDREGWAHQIDNLELATDAAPLTIQPGKFYRTRDGRKVGPMVRRADYDGEYPWREGHESDHYPENTWQNDGFWFFTGDDDKSDLIAEWVYEPEQASPEPAAVPAAKFKVGDRVRAVSDSDFDIKIDNVYTVTEADADGFIIFVDDGGDDRYRYGADYELVDTQVSADLTVGQSVTLAEPARITGFKNEHASLVLASGGTYTLPLAALVAA